MKKLSDYKGDEAIELWADLLEPLTSILSDEKIRKTIQSGKSKIEIAKIVLKKKKKEATEILLRIDPEPLDGLNIILRLVAVLVDLGQNEEIKSFFGFAEMSRETAEEFSGSPTESTEVEEK